MQRTHLQDDTVNKHMKFTNISKLKHIGAIVDSVFGGDATLMFTFELWILSLILYFNTLYVSQSASPSISCSAIYDTPHHILCILYPYPESV